jgi:hypothetical protein
MRAAAEAAQQRADGWPMRAAAVAAQRADGWPMRAVAAQSASCWWAVRAAALTQAAP